LQIPVIPVIAGGGVIIKGWDFNSLGAEAGTLASVWVPDEGGTLPEADLSAPTRGNVQIRTVHGEIPQGLGGHHLMISHAVNSVAVAVGDFGV